MVRKRNNKPVHEQYWPLVKLGHSILTTSLLQSWVYVLLFTAWATCVALICDKVQDLSFDSVLLGVFGTILGFIISFRTSTAFERYNEGKKLLASIAYASRTFARIVWFHVPLDKAMGVSKASEGGSQDWQDLTTPNILSKPNNQNLAVVTKSPSEILEEKRTAIGLIEAFNLAVKHHLREIGLRQNESELPNAHREDINAQERPRAKRTDSSWASDVTARDISSQSGDAVIDVDSESTDKKEQQITDKTVIDRTGPTSGTGQGVPQVLSRSKFPARNVPLEISFCLSSYIVALQERQADGSATNNMLMSLNLLVQAFTDLEKVSADQIPFSYRFQLWSCAYLYIFFLPFQLWKHLTYIAIPGTSLAALIFLGLLSAGEEIENPFNGDRNDLDMDRFCDDFSQELETLMATSISTFNSEAREIEGRIDRVLKYVKLKEKGEEKSESRETWLGRKWEQASGRRDGLSR